MLSDPPEQHVSSNRENFQDFISLKIPKSSIREQKPPITTEEGERKRNREAGRIKGIPWEEKLT